MKLEQLLECGLDQSGELPVMIPAAGGDFIEVTLCEVDTLTFLNGESGLAFLLTSEEKPDRNLPDDAPLHTWFGLSYAQYLTIPRSVMQSMPSEWQQRMTQCLEELDEAIDWRPKEGCYIVALRGNGGKFLHDPLKDYERGRRHIPHRTDSDDAD